MPALATAIEAEAARRREAAAALSPVEPIPVALPTVPVPVAVVSTTWRAWWEDHDMWDGSASYVDRDTALLHAAVDYVGEEYGWPEPEDLAEGDWSAPEALSWAWEHGRWHLSDGGRSTLVQVFEERVYGPAVAAGADQ